MDIRQFLDKVVPSKGFFVISIPKEKAGHVQHVYESKEILANRAISFDAQGYTVFFTPASFAQERVERTSRKTGATYKTTRVQENALGLRSFWMDLDVGSEPGKYATQVEGVKALAEFCQITGLPVPMIVSSGRGIHVYWPLTEDITPELWKHTAERLKHLAAGAGLKSDPARTSDSASLLRPPGTHNRKDPMNPLPVAVVRDAEPIPYATFDAAIEEAFKQLRLPIPKEARAKDTIETASPLAARSDPELVASKCPQIRLFKAAKGDVPEPIWYASLQVLRLTTGGDEICHSWSSGHPGYSIAETQERLERLKDFGPTTCAHFESVNPDGCKGCPFKGKIGSPIQLGVRVQAAAQPVAIYDSATVELPAPPAPFLRGSDESGQVGIYVNVSDIPILVHPYDIFPVERGIDEDHARADFKVRHFRPIEQYSDALIPLKSFARASDLYGAMLDSGILVTEEKIKLMKRYLESYMREIEAKVPSRKRFNSLGWKDDGSFVLGERVYLPDGKVQTAALAPSIRNFGIHTIRPTGDFAQWKETTKYLSDPRLFPMAFTLLTAFGAPLVHLTGYKGALISLYGETGAGKSLSAWLMNSVYGDHTALQVGKTSTPAFTTQKMGAYHNLPIYIDEITNSNGGAISDLAYGITTGQGRGRLNSDASAKEATTWATLAVASTNTSLLDRLRENKANPDAEVMRIIEIPFKRHRELKPVHEWMARTLQHNYGHAGPAYIQAVLSNKPRVVELLNKTAAYLEDKFNAQGEERYWMNTIAANLVGGTLAFEAGLIAFNPLHLIDWLGEIIQAMRKDFVENHTDPKALVSQYLDETLPNRLIVKDVVLPNGESSTQVLRAPTRELYVRVELGPERMPSKILISRQHIREWLGERSVNAREVAKALEAEGYLVSAGTRRCLGKGTDLDTGQVWCWELRLEIQTDPSTLV